jgi:hypothetical protein
MATSTNYGWAEPDNTDLVTNGALAIRTLGNAIDTSLWNSGYGQAAKNKIINGDFSVNQRNFTTISGGGFGFDRFNCATSGATATSSAQTFALGTAPVAGYEGKNFLRWAVTTGNDYCRVLQTIESVRTFAGQTVTLSFWAKGTNPTTAGNLRVRLSQYFGTGGSPSAGVSTAEQTFVLTAGWTRYSFVLSVPSISGKTIGTNNDDGLQVDIGQLSNASTDAWTLDLWGVQLEYGSKATPFQTASGGSIQGELAMCQRYFQIYPTGADAQAWSGQFYSTTAARLYKDLPVTMRTSSQTITLPTGTFTNFIEQVGVATRTPTTLTTGSALANRVYFDATGMSSATSGAMAVWAVSNQISISAEL